MQAHMTSKKSISETIRLAHIELQIHNLTWQSNQAYAQNDT